MAAFSGESKIRHLLAEACGIEPASIGSDAQLIEYGLDSARAIDLLVALEEAFGVQIPDEAATKMRTFADVVAYVRARVEEKT